MSAWTPIDWTQLGPEHLGTPVYVRFPEKYARDFTFGTFEGMETDQTTVNLVFRGGQRVDMMREGRGSDPQPVVYVLR